MANKDKKLVTQPAPREMSLERVLKDSFLFLKNRDNQQVKRIIAVQDLQVGLKDNNYPGCGLVLQSHTAPQVTSNKLYNVDGTLHFDGRALSSGSSATSAFFTSSESGFMQTTGSVSFAGGLGYGVGTNDQGLDTFLFVSGALSSKDSSTRGAAVFGGDVVVSGALHGASPLQIGEYRTDLGSDIALYISGSKSSKNKATGGVSLFGGDIVVSGTIYAEKYVVEVDETVTGSLMVSGTLIVSQSGIFYEGLTVNESGEGGTENDFRVETLNFTHGIFVDTSQDQVLILSGGASTSPSESTYLDTNFFVSGSPGSRGTAVRGTSVFGGDLVVSGTIFSSGGQNRTKTVYALTATHPSSSPLTIAGTNFSVVNYDPNRIDIYLNGQLMSSGSALDYELVYTANDKATFSFELANEDIVAAMVL